MTTITAGLLALVLIGVFCLGYGFGRAWCGG